MPAYNLFYSVAEKRENVKEDLRQQSAKSGLNCNAQLTFEREIS